MKKIILLLFLSILCIEISAQTMAIVIKESPYINKLKWKGFDEFVDGYNSLNNLNLAGFNRPKVGVRTGIDIYVWYIYFGIYQNSFHMNTKPLELSPIAKRQFMLRNNSTMFNIGYRLSKGFGKLSLGFSPYCAVGFQSTNLDVYMTYYDKYKSYGTKSIDGTYHGTAIAIGYGLNVNATYKFLFASLGFTKLTSSAVSLSLWDWDSQKNGKYDKIGTNYSAYIDDQNNSTFSYTGPFLKPNYKQFCLELSLGLFIGETNKK